MLGTYNTSDYPIIIVVVSLLNIFVPLLSLYCYYYAPYNPTIFIFFPLYYYC